MQQFAVRVWSVNVACSPLCKLLSGKHWLQGSIDMSQSTRVERSIQLLNQHPVVDRVEHLLRLRHGYFSMVIVPMFCMHCKVVTKLTALCCR